MSLVAKIAAVLLGALVLVLGAGFLLPSQVHVERAMVMSATPEKIFPLISDFNAWESWSPWADGDPEATMEIAGSGLGQTMTWSRDNPAVGTGSQEVTEIQAPTYLKTHLDFGQQGRADAAFRLIPEDSKTRVVWSLDTDMRAGVPLLQQPISTYFGFLMDGMIGKDYETGLQRLKQLVEG